MTHYWRFPSRLTGNPLVNILCVLDCAIIQCACQPFRKTLKCLTTCLPNSASVIHVAACNPKSVRKGRENYFSYLVLRELLLAPTCPYGFTADQRQTWQFVIFRIYLFLCFESRVYFLSISNLLLLFLCNFSKISGVISTVKSTSFFSTFFLLIQ